jgi:integrase/recombinase XerD
MNSPFAGPLAKELTGFLAFKRALGSPYRRAEFTLREFDRFLQRYTRSRRRWRFREALLAWLASKKGRKPVTVTVEMGAIRQFCRYRRRYDPTAFVPGRIWAPQSTVSEFLPHIFSPAEIRELLSQAAGPCRSCATMAPGSLRLLLLILYCTGLRLGEAARLKLRDVDLRRAVIFVSESKGRSRWVPFHRSMLHEFAKYLRARREIGPMDVEAPLFLRGGRPLSVRAASDYIRRLLRRAGFKSARGRQGPRPYDMRHTFAVRRLERWYRAGIDIHERLPWLSAYMGHLDILGTEAYLTATPELLGRAARRFRNRLGSSRRAL